MLYLTGYLTKVRDKDLTDSLPDGCSALMIPNAEIREIFETTVSKWFDDSAKAGTAARCLMQSGAETTKL